MKSRWGSMAMLSVLLAAGLVAPSLAHAQDDDARNPTDCYPVTDPDVQFQQDLCSAHLGCRLVFAIHRTCTSVHAFIDHLAGRDDAQAVLTSEDVFEADEAAVAPEASWSERLGQYVEDAKQRVGAVFGGSEPARTSTVDGTYYEGAFDDTHSGAGISIGPDGAMSRGEFRQGQLSGAGQALSPQGAMAAGHFENGALGGDGVERAPDGVEVAGTFDGGHPVGQVVLTYPDGSTQRVLYDDAGTELARGDRAPRGEPAAEPADPRAGPVVAGVDVTPPAAAQECQGERQAAYAAFFGASPTDEQRSMFETQVASRGLGGDLAAVQQGWKDFSTAPAANERERTGNAYSACLFRARLLQLDPATDFARLAADAQEDATDKLFASLPARNGGGDGTSMLLDSTDPARRAAHEADRARKLAAAAAEREARQASNNAFWSALGQVVSIGAQTYANYEVQQAQANLAASAAASQQAVVQQAALQQALLASQRTASPPPSAGYACANIPGYECDGRTPVASAGVAKVNHPENDGSACVAVRPKPDCPTCYYYVNECPWPVAVLGPSGYMNLAVGGSYPTFTLPPFRYAACRYGNRMDIEGKPEGYRCTGP
jgi:hypothetical protein